jgi:hypothetical protein
LNQKIAQHASLPQVLLFATTPSLFGFFFFLLVLGSVYPKVPF